LPNSLKIALVGNPNCGKTSLFNALTGLHQKVANYPGVTVEKKTGICKLTKTSTAEIIDLPGTYSLYPKSIDEFVAFDVLVNPSNESRPDLIIVVLDASNLKRNLFFCSQIIDLQIPIVVALNMMDLLYKSNQTIDVAQLSAILKVPVIPINARRLEGIPLLKKEIASQQPISSNQFLELSHLAPVVVQSIKNDYKITSNYASLLIAHHYINIFCLDASSKEKTKKLLLENQFKSNALQGEETLLRYDKINNVLNDVLKQGAKADLNTLENNNIDKVLTHPLYGYLFFLLIMFIVFQLIYFVAEYPKQWMEDGFMLISNSILEKWPKSFLADLFVNGILSGLSGVLTFLPQILLLFGFISILEDSGYMARISFLMDKLMKQIGLNGRSVVPLIGGMACAVPAIMSARTIENAKDRLITILVTPLMSCSARLPVYTVLIGLIVPKNLHFFIFNIQGLILFGMYLLGFVMVIFASIIFKLIIKSTNRSYFIMELPGYKLPRFQNILYTMFQKAKVFTLQAGKVIIAISMILWVLCSFGPGYKFKEIENKYTTTAIDKQTDNIANQSNLQAEKLENSYAGHLGKAIEPLIAPIGFDWKIGIALITSFAAREVFVGTMSTLYSVGNSDSKLSIQEKMSVAKDKNNKPTYSLATIISLMLFYAFALQCMSTVAIVYKETNSWKIPVFQIIFMTALAYLSSFIAYQLLK
jgi:ferrous iron transport protein B